MRNGDWFHLVADDVISMPDTWEYPWFAAWDLAFHAVALGLVDLDFAKDQLDLLLSRRYLHPNGQIPAYEWNFSDVNPPVHAWATLPVYELEKASTAARATAPSWRRVFQSCSKNFTWWVNRKDADGRNVFQGGFLGLDNIGVFDRSAPLPDRRPPRPGRRHRVDGAVLPEHAADRARAGRATTRSTSEQAPKFFEHFAWIAAAMNRARRQDASMWDEEDGFFYDVLRLPDGSAHPAGVRSMVGLLPLARPPSSSPERRRARSRTSSTQPSSSSTQFDPSVAAGAAPGRPRPERRPARAWRSLVEPERLRRILARMLDETEFLSPYGIRSLSRHHAEHPYVFDVDGQSYRVDVPAGGVDSGMFGGNSNWRGPVWFPMNALIDPRRCSTCTRYYGDDFTVECPTGSGGR